MLLQIPWRRVPRLRIVNIDQIADAEEAFDFASDLEELEHIEAELARRNLFLFIQKTWHVVEPKKEFISNWHIEEMCHQLERVTKGETSRLIVNVPPGTMKTLLILVFWPAWEWASDPSLRYLTASYAASRTIDANQKVRDIVNSPWYQKHYPEVKFTSDQNAKELFKTDQKGERRATSVGGEGTGIHPDRIIIDDPITADDARSDEVRKGVNDWFDQTLSIRGAIRKTKIILVMQRLHKEDLTGHILSKHWNTPGLWLHVRWPMRYVPSRPPSEQEPEGFVADPLDPRTEPGQLLWPEAFTEEMVRNLELTLGPYGTAGQLQQQPSPEGGGLFKRAWFGIVDMVPKGKVVRRCRGWDTAATEGSGDWTCGVLLAEVDGVVYVEDVVYDQLGPAGVDELFRNTAKADGRMTMQREEKEPAASGVAVIHARARLLRGYDYAGVTVSKDKVTRARPFRAQAEARNVFLKRAPWNNMYLSALVDFPTGTMNHPVDGSSCAYNAIVEEPMPVSATWGKKSA